MTTISHTKEKFAPITMDNGLIFFVPYITKILPTTVPSTWTQELVNTLSYMGNEERLAYDVYNRLYREWGTKQFINIASKSEIKHIQSVQALIQKYKLNETDGFSNIDLPSLGYIYTDVTDMSAGTYDIAKIQVLYDDLISIGMTSEIEALKVGCIVEVVDIDDLDKYIKIAEASKADDVIETFTFLRDGSYNHYWTFDSALKNKGVSAGCCTWAELCHPEYPDNKNGNKEKSRNKK
jgi:hypothetical protein